MIHELRSYQLKPGAGPKYLSMLADEGVPHVSKHLPLLGFWLAETGALNTLWHLWAYEDWAEREAARAALAGDSNWMDGFVPKAFVVLEAQENRFLQLERSSPAYDAALAKRKQPCTIRAADTPLFAPDCAGLLTGAQTADAIAVWRVISGGAAEQISLLPRRANPLPAAPTNGQHTILRPVIFSRL